MATLTTQTAALAGLSVSYASAAAGGDQCATGQGLVLLVDNGDASSHTVTLATPGTVDGLAIADRTVTVAAGATAVIPLNDIYRDPSTGRASLTYDGVTSVKVAVVRVP